uniref:RAP domain-containing protein n=1 Tax=Alexandrium monilatum TaxID=311494 RepID=A0A7S4QKA6_9DINO
MLPRLSKARPVPARGAPACGRSLPRVFVASGCRSAATPLPRPSAGLRLGPSAPGPGPGEAAGTGGGGGASAEDGAGAPEPLRSRSELLSTWAAPGSAVYANPVCSQLDQLLLRCRDAESVLALLVTHRGVFFVHNLVTAMQVLAGLAEEAGNPVEVNALLRDPRYDLLVRDLLRFVPKLDFLAMANVACSLRQLDHKHYTLLSRMLGPLLGQPAPDVAALLRCVRAYSWAGYRQEHRLYQRCGEALAERADTLPPEELVEASVLFAGAARYHGGLFRAVERALLAGGCLERGGLLRPRDAALLASAFTAHLQTGHDDLLCAVGAVLEREAAIMEPVDIICCLAAFRRVALRLDGAMQAGFASCITPLRRAWLLRQRVDGVRPSHVATLLDCASYFGIQTGAVGAALDYLADVVDELSDGASIRVVHAMCLTGGVATHASLLPFLVRKLGAGSAWEGQRARVFQLWVSQLLQFPWLEARLPRRCVEQGLRAWCLRRRGYGCPFPEDVHGVSAELSAMGVVHRTFVAVPGTPYEVDVAVGGRKDALLVASETSRNTLQPVGGVLLQVRHLEARGWRCVLVPRQVWRSLGGSSADARQDYLRSLLAAHAS